MKTLKYSILISAFAAAASLNAADYTLSVSGGSFNETSSWTVDGSPATELPSYADNVTIGSSGHFPVGYNFDDPSTSVLKANDLTILGETRFDPSNKEQWTSHAAFTGSREEWSLVAPSIDITGNLTTDGSDVCFGRGYGGIKGYNFKSISVGGDFNITGNAKFTWLGDNYAYSSENPSLRVQGQVVINNDGRFQVDYGSENSAYIKIGGLDSAWGKVTNGNEYTKMSVLEFTQSGAGVFKGGDFTGFIGRLGGSDGGFLIKMNNTGGSSARQVIRLNRNAKEEPDTTNYINVEVNAGILEIYSDGEDGLNTLNLTGGTFGIAAPNSSVSTGMAKFSNDFTWTAGKIEITVNIDNMNADILEVNNLILAGSDATYEFVFDMLGDFDETTIMHLKILTLAEGNTFGADILSKLVGTTSDGLYIANFGLNVENNELYLNGFSQIPEPAEVAAFIGAVALAFAAWRRRK